MDGAFGGKLEIGMPAMIIGCRHPENSWVIGKVVMIEAFTEVGEKVDPRFVADGFRSAHIHEVRCAIVSGIHTHYLLKENYANIAEKFLMPLPPLGDVDIMDATEKPKEAIKC